MYLFFSNHLTGKFHYRLLPIFIICLSSCGQQEQGKQHVKEGRESGTRDKTALVSQSNKSVQVDLTEPAAPPEAEPYQKRDPGTITFSGDIAPIVFKNCALCHQEGEVAPFSLVTFDDYAKRGEQITMVLESRFMPPWPPTPEYVDYKHDRSLSVDQIGLIKQWIDEGCEPGNLEKLPEIEKREGEWLLGEPDQIVSMKAPFELGAEGKDLFRKFVMEVPGEGARYVRAFEFKPVNKKVVHHARMTVDTTSWSRYLDEQDEEEGFDAMEAGEESTPESAFPVWTPGYTSLEGIKGAAWKLPDGSDFILELHLFRSGKVESIQSKIGFYFTKEPPKVKPCLVKLCSQTIDLPAGEEKKIEDSFTMPVDGTVMSVYPHAHYLCRDMKGYAILPDGTKKWLLRIKKWDFNWQDIYYLEDPIYLPKGSIIKMSYLFDNSSENIYNPNHPPVRVRFGPKTDDEMADFFLQIITKNDKDHQVLHREFLKKENKVNVGRFLADIKFNPEDHFAHFMLGYYYSKQGEFGKAVDHYKKCILYKEDYPRVRNNLASILAKQGKFIEAKKYYQGAIRIDPKDVKAYNNLGITMYRLNDIKAAEKCFKNAIALNSGFAEAQCNLGHIYVRQNKLKEASQQYQKALDIKPSYTVAKKELDRTKALIKNQKKQKQSL